MAVQCPKNKSRMPKGTGILNPVLRLCLSDALIHYTPPQNDIRAPRNAGFIVVILAKQIKDAERNP